MFKLLNMVRFRGDEWCDYLRGGGLWRGPVAGACGGGLGRGPGAGAWGGGLGRGPGAGACGGGLWRGPGAGLGSTDYKE